MTQREMEEMNALYGRPGTGAKHLDIPAVGRHASIVQVLAWLGVGSEGEVTIDGLRLRKGLWMVRYYDGNDESIHAMEFDASGHILTELRAHIADFIGDEEFYTHWGMRKPPWEIH